MAITLAHEVRFKTHTPCPKCKTAMERTKAGYVDYLKHMEDT